jgi:hypothetical protein
MIPEDERARRGEPVIVMEGTKERKGTIEWGGVTKPASIYCETGGRLVNVALTDIRSDPGGERPVWRRVSTP